MTKLYTPEILSLAVSLADYPRLNAPDASAEARSRTCGGTLTLDLMLDPEARVEALGLAVSACAIGQAAAAVFARAAQGCTTQDMRASLKRIEAWLGDEGEELPDWPGFAVLKPARAFPGRHGAILLPWRAATDALCKAGQPR